MREGNPDHYKRRIKTAKVPEKKKWSLFRKPEPRPGKFDRVAEKAGEITDALTAGAFALAVASTFAEKQGAIDAQKLEDHAALEARKMYERYAKDQRASSLASLEHDLEETAPELKKEMQVVQEQYGFKEQISEVLTQAERPNPLYNGLSVRQYIEQHLFEGVSDKDLPPEIRAELARFLRGWVTKESMFNPHAKNKNVNDSYDIGLFQLNTDTLADFGIKSEEAVEELRNDLPAQVELVNRVMVFKLRELRENAGSALNWITRVYCEGDEVECARYVESAFLLLSWNAGHKRASDLLNEFWNKYKNDPNRPVLKGYGIVQHIISSTENERFTDVGRRYLAGILGYEAGYTQWHLSDVKLTKAEKPQTDG